MRINLLCKNKYKIFFCLICTVLIFFVLFILFKGNIKNFKKYVPPEVKAVAKIILRIPITNIKLCVCDPDRDIKFERDDGLAIAGSLYGINGLQKRPGILLLHGNTPLGRKLALYKILATKLAARGYIVLAIDFTGFGESDDPFSLGKKEALDRDKDVYAALDYLKTLTQLNQEKIYIIGHSGGAENAFSVGIQEAMIKKIVAIGPGRRVSERMQKPGDRNYFWKRSQQTRLKIYKKKFPSWYTKDYWLKKMLNGDMEKHISYFSESNHKPLLLIDGELEDEKDKAYLKNYYMKLSEPKEYITISKSDHYFNTVGIGRIAFFDEKLIEKVLDEIVQWLNL